MSYTAEQKRIEAILVAGELAGLAFRLDADVLEKFLENAPADFRYEKTCRAAIAFRRAIAAALARQ